MCRLTNFTWLAVLTLVLFANPVQAVIFSGTTTDVSANFVINGGNLVITLSNDSTADITMPSEVLTGLFFTLPNVTLTPVSAIVTNGFLEYDNGILQTAPPNFDVGSVWAYKAGLSVKGATQGVGASGFSGVFGPPDIFPFSGAALTGDTGNPPDGLAYGITTAGDDLNTDNGGLGARPLIKNSVVFTFSGVTANTDLSTLAHVNFQYGTALSEPNDPGVPEPTSPAVPEPFSIIVWSLLGATWAGVAAVRRRRAIAASRTAWSPEARSAIYKLIEQGHH
jgi:hypothetical protein